MGKSAAGARLDALIAKHVAPLLAPVGVVARDNHERPRVGLVARTLARRFSDGSQLVVQLWCDGGDEVRNLRWRADHLVGDLWHDLHPDCFDADPRYPRPVRRDDLAQFHPERSPENLERAFAYLGMLLVELMLQLPQRLPELAADVAAAAATPAWKDAVAKAPELWKNRHAQGGVDATELPGKLVYVGAQLVIVEVAGARHTFRFDTAGVDRNAAVAVGGWWTTPAGTRAAATLRIGQRTWRFDFRGALEP